MILLHIIGGLIGLTSGAVAFSVFVDVLLAGARLVHTVASYRMVIGCSKPHKIMQSYCPIIVYSINDQNKGVL